MLSKFKQRLKFIAGRSSMAVFMALVISMSNVGVESSQAAINTSPVGSGFTVTAADLTYILRQIKISEYHAANTTSGTGLCGALLGNGPNQISSNLLSFGLRTVDGSCNNLVSGQENHGAADQTFPRLATPNFGRPTETAPPGFPSGQTTYNQASGFFYDNQPRLASNLIVDQTSTNPAAIAAAGFPIRTQADPDSVVPCTTEPTNQQGNNGLPTGCVPAHQTLFIPNVTTDVGLSPPFNSLFTIFGQFFDHGLDKITNGGNGTVFIPLKNDDPLVAGPDHDFGTSDDLPSSLRFMPLTRGTIVNDANGVRNAPNTDTPFVDQSQTYTSHPSHQVFLREYVLIDNKPVATGKFLSGDDGFALANWKQIKEQAAQKLGLQLNDVDVQNIPEILTDPYGNFVPGPDRGLPLYVTSSGTVEGDLANPVAVPASAVRINTAFLNDIAFGADPGSFASPKTDDGNNTAGTNLANIANPLPSGQYDKELLDLHSICGDGRCNENIGLAAVHQVFHSEHDRLVDDISATLALPANASLKAAYDTVNLNPGPNPNKTFTVGERLFQAARFVTEMQYQHLVFEEFARKVQPLINPFEAFAFNQTDVNPAITAEFAHAVYRFGHSMLTETIPRLNSADSVTAGAPLHNDISLFSGFLNPAEYNRGGNNRILDTPHATGAIIMGLSDQVGNEIDEFVSDTLRNKLLGLPLDLPSLNMARARSEGIPSLNNFRKQVWARTNDGQLTPYEHWIDFSLNLKHPESLVNFIAAYGKHPLLTTRDPDGSGPILAGSLKARRIVADQIVNGTTLPGPDGILYDNPDTECTTLPNDPAGCDESADNLFPPEDISDFVFSTGSWVNVNGVSQTGLDDVDLWMGGLAEITNLFGGLLGSTFNYVFEKQLTDLQNGDRFYYLARTPGMNLRSQLEGNSFAELVMRNTNAHTLKADPFATADCKFEGANLFEGNPQDFIDHGSIVADDLASECREDLLLIRFPDGSIRYRATNTIDPPGINGQAVYNGTEFADRFMGGNDNDTFWGGLGNDIIDGKGGDDVILGGEGDDIITDSAGNDFLKGGPGNDAIDGGIGDDIIIAGGGKDFTNGGANINETFSGEGDDFAIAGQGTDAVFGDSGDDWEEGGDQPDLLIGDSSTLFFDDHNLPGHDILIGQGGDDDYDMEGGDDIGVAGPGVEKNAGAAGYDWSIGLGDPGAQNADLALPIVNAPPANEVRDRFNEVEALSGWDKNDTLRGDSIVPSAVGGIGFIGCDALDADGVARIGGLDALVPASIRTVDPAATVASAVTNYCGLEGPIWGEGNILLGGAGSDTLEGRGADDILDGDRYLNVRLSVRTNPASPATEYGSTGLMENAAVTGNFGPGTEGMNLQQAVFAGKVNPGNIVAVREILTPPALPADCGVAAPLNCDTAVFSGPEAEYTLTANVGDLVGSLKVTDLADPANAAPIAPAVARDTDGINDTLWNMEQVSFCTTPGAVRGACDLRTAPIPVAPSAVVATGSLAFGARILNTTTTQTVTVRNNGLTPLTVGSINASGTDAAMFTVTGGTCTGATLRRNGPTCSISVAFKPTSGGVKSANIVINHNPTGAQSIIPASGEGTGPVANVSVTSLAFGDQNTGTTSATRTVTLTNTGNATLTINSITGIPAGAEFGRVAAPAPSCGATLTAGSTCNINVRFTPAAAGVRNGLITITDNSNGVLNSTQTVQLTGTGVVQLPTAVVAPTALDFGNVVVGGTFNRTVTLTNTGTGTTPMSITGIAVSTGAGFSRVTGAGAVAPNCGTTLASGASCNITVRFAPTNALGGGAKTGLLTVSDNSGNAPSQQPVQLTGNGTIDAVDDATTVAANGTALQTIAFNVRANDVTNNAASVVSITSSSFTNGGATAVATVNGATSQQITWTLTAPASATTAALRQASKRGTYTVNYTLTNGTATDTATYILTVN